MTDAIHTPVRRSRGTNTENLEMEQPSPIVLPEMGEPLVVEREPIIPVESKSLNSDHMEALKFNEDELIIILQPSSEENAPMVIDVAVNGESKWVRVGVEEKLKRKFVEVLIRSKPISVQTTHDEVGAKVINNRILRHQRAKYPLSVMYDPSPKGSAWLHRVYMEQ